MEAVAVIQARHGVTWAGTGVAKGAGFLMYSEMDSTEFADCLDMETERGRKKKVEEFGPELLVGLVVSN